MAVLKSTSFKYTKNYFFIFHPFNKPVKEVITIKISNKAISEEMCVKYLGILIDSTLSWKSQISTITKKYQDLLA